MMVAAAVLAIALIIPIVNTLHAIITKYWWCDARELFKLSNKY
jgi:hypothetical protein